MTHLHPVLPLLVACCLTLGSMPQAPPDPEWDAWIGEVPLVDLSGDWDFVPGESDAMVEEWAGVPIRYRIDQSSDSIRLEFVPEGSAGNVQIYRWDGSLATFQRGGQEVRERARWQGGGRELLIEGRRWERGDAEVTKYLFEYRLESTHLLRFTQRDDFGDTVWKFRRR